jgi:RNA-directed DNA polymerase
MLHAWEKYGLELAQEEFYRKRKLEGSEISYRDVVKGKIEFLGNVKGEGDSIYVKFLEKLKQLSPKMISNQKLEQARAQLEKSKHKEKLICNIWTEGKTDVMHLKAALKDFQDRGQFQDLEIRFEDDIDHNNWSDSRLIERCKFSSDVQNSIPMIAIFDRDSLPIIKEAHDETRGYKVWGNNVYSFAIPIPRHREGELNICIEHYYKDNEIKRQDSKGRRIFLSNEFNSTSLRHRKDGDLSVPRLSNDKIKIIDNAVFNSEDINVALPKADFATNVFEQIENFDDFDFTEFIAIFENIRKILKSRNANESVRQSKRTQR